MMLKQVVVLMISAGLCAPMSRAGIIATGDVNPANPATWRSWTKAYIGETGTGNVTVDDDSDLVSRHGYLGDQSGSTGAVTVSGAGSTWTNSESLDVGLRGDGTLDITNGGAATTGSGTIGHYSGSTGTVTVSGAGSTWTNSGVIVGYNGYGTLDITNGGAVSNSVGLIGNDSGSTGAVTVSGAGSTWTNSDALRVGLRGNGSLDITNGGAVSSMHNGYIGRYSGSTGTVTVSGAGSTWTNSDDLYVGDSGDGTLNIADGGLVVVSGDTYVTRPPGSDGAINFDNGTLTTDGFLGAVANLSGTGTINARGLVSDLDLVFDATHGLTQTLTLSGPGRNITVNLDVDGSSPIGAGYGGNGSMHVSDGVTVQSTDGWLGYQPGSTGAVTVSGAGSTWNSGSLFVGYCGSGTLNIADGGLVVVSKSTHVASQPGSAGTINFDNGTLTTGGFLGAVADLSGTGTINTTGLVSDVNLVFDAAHGLAQTLTLNSPGRNITVNLDVDGSASMGVGYGGNGSMHISDGVTVQSTHGRLGYHSSSTGAVTVSGVGSTWTISGYLFVGRYGNGTLDITDGGAVSTTRGYIGDEPGSTGEVTVSGVGSTWTNSSYLYVGDAGNGTLDVSDGGAVSTTRGGIIGHQSDSTGAVTVSGADSTWTNSSNLSVGRYGNGTLDITDGAAVSNKRGYIGNEPGSTGKVTVSGAGSTWTNSDNLYVGFQGDATLDISDGGAVSNANYGYVSSVFGSTGLVTVSGAGSTWTNSTLYINDTLDISDGGAVSSAYYGYIGSSTGSTGAVTVSGAGATWTISNYLYVGNYGDGTLDITNGGAVSYTLGYIGNESGSTGTVTVSGAGSTWTNSSSLYVAYKGDGTLDIIDGGAVSSFGGDIGFYFDSIGAVTVGGGGSTWTNSSSLYVGYKGDGTLNIADGGLVSVAGGVTIGDNVDGVGFINIGTAGELTVTEEVNVGSNGSLRVDGALAAASVDCTGTLSGSGVIDAPVTVANGGTVSPGGGIGTLTTGDTTFQPNSTLLIELSGPPSGDGYDQLAVTGELNLDAADNTLLLQWMPGNDSASKFGGDYVVATYSTRVGEFDSVGGGGDPYNISEAYVAGVDYLTGNQITVSLLPLLDGDADLDGKVWLADWSLLRANFGNSGTGMTWTDGNFDPWTDDKVWLSDWAALRANFSNQGTIVAEDHVAAVPEPGTLMLLLAGLAGGWLARPRRRSPARRP